MAHCGEVWGNRDRKERKPHALSHLHPSSLALGDGMLSDGVRKGSRSDRCYKGSLLQFEMAS